MTDKRIQGLRTCIYTVTDLQAATAWYSHCFDTRPYFEESFYVGFSIGGYELGLVPSEHGASSQGGVLTYWGVDNVEAVYQAFLDHGASEHEAPHWVGGDITVASVLDPWSNIIGLIHNPSFSLEPPPVH